MSSIPEGEAQQSSVARQVFSEATPTANVSESEAKAAEDIPAASADDTQEEERVPTPPLLKKLFSRRTCLCPTLQLIKWR